MTIVKITFIDGYVEHHECASVTVNSKEDFVDLYDVEGEDMCSFDLSGIKLLEISTKKGDN